jgi:hypothetical protein
VGTIRLDAAVLFSCHVPWQKGVVMCVSCFHVWSLTFLASTCLTRVNPHFTRDHPFSQSSDGTIASRWDHECEIRTTMRAWYSVYVTFTNSWLYEKRLKVKAYEGVSKSFRTGRLERELQMVQLSATRCSCIAIL